MKKKIKTEQNIIIIMDAIKKIMTIFLGPFLTAIFNILLVDVLIK